MTPVLVDGTDLKTPERTIALTDDQFDRLIAAIEDRHGDEADTVDEWASLQDEQRPRPRAMDMGTRPGNGPRLIGGKRPDNPPPQPRATIRPPRPPAATPLGGRDRGISTRANTPGQPGLRAENSLPGK